MKSIKKSHRGKTTGLIALLATFALASCDPNQFAPEPDASGAIQFSSNTRNGETAFNTGDEIGIFMTHTGTGIAAAITSNARFINTASGFTTATPIYFPAGEQAVDFVAYSPWRDLAGATTLPVDVTNQENRQALHLLYSNNATNKTRSATPVALVFNHAMSRIVINTVPGAGITGADLEGMNVHLWGMSTQAHFSPATGTFQDRAGSDLNIPLLAVTNGQQYSAILIPDGAATGRRIVFTVNGSQFTATIPAADTFLAGHSIVYTATINRTGVTLSSGQITNWNISPDQLDLGEATPPPPPYVAINGTRWATRNLDMPNTFAEHPHSAGRFYQWGTLGGETHHWHATEPIHDTWNSSLLRAAWTTANHPCPAGWRLPNQAEVTALNDARSTWHANWNNTGVSGRVFPAAATVAQITGASPTAIFLPAAGWRGGANGVLEGQGTIGYYWSSTGSGLMAVYLRFISIGTAISNNVFRSGGHSVRCVKA